jgi:superfamily II DNA or RNA helicase
MREFIQNLKISYHSGFDDNLGKDFYSPCLSKCNEYKRTTGDFTSNVIFDWGEALINIIEKDEGKCIVKIIANPNLAEEDRIALSTFVDNQNRNDFYDKVTHNIFKDALDIVEKNLNRDKSKEIKLKIFCYLITTRKLILKFGFPKHVHNANVFHTKCGIFYFDDNLKVGFTGSSNETHGGHLLNIEQIHTYHNLDKINPYIEDIEEKFELSWEGKAPGFDTRKVNKKTLDLITSYAPNRSQVKEYVKKFKEELTDTKIEITENQKQSNFVNANIKIKQNYLDILESQWSFQEKARKIFIEKKYGLLEMATGTGKTRTALSIVTELLKTNKINKIIVQMEGNDLLTQWKDNILEWTNSETYSQINFLQYTSKKNQLNDFIYNFKNDTVDLILVSAHNLPILLDEINKNDLSKTIIIHDEVHGLFTPGTKEKILGKQTKFGYRLGLSATISDGFDLEREETLFYEVGPKIFTYTLENAIEDGVLVEFDLIHFTYKLTDEEISKKKGLFANHHSKIKMGIPAFIADLELSIALADINKNAVNKIEVFEKNLDQFKPYLKRSFIFADESIYVDQVMEKLIFHNINVKKHVGDASYKNIEAFSRGEIDCLLNCEKLSQGIDVKSVNNIILFATPKGRQLIQRLGRVLRSDLINNPEKRACVIDFYEENDMLLEKGPEYERYKKLKKWSLTRKK